MLLRWHTAAACKNTDGGNAIQKFRKKWEMTGMVVFNPPAIEPTLVFFMHAAKRARWQRRRDEGTYRRPPYAPPDDRDLPRDTITIYIDGVAGPRKKGEPPPPAGYGCCMVSGGKRIFDLGGRIVAGQTPKVRTTTSNLACLVAITHALKWADERCGPIRERQADTDMLQRGLRSHDRKRCLAGTKA